MNKVLSPIRLTMLMLLVLLGASFKAGAYDFTYNNVYFKILDANAKTCEVTQNPAKYHMNWSIPAHPVYNGATWTCVAVGDSAFKDCNELLTVSLPETVERIGSYAFLNCSNLLSIAIPSSVKRIGGYAFMDCDKFESITIPDQVEDMGMGVFFGCDQLASATWGRGMTEMPQYTFYNCPRLSNFTMPWWITNIQYCAFAYTGLEQAILPYGLKTIGGSAFKGSHINTVLIPSSVTSLWSDAFNYCSSLTTIYCNMNVAPVMEFTNVPQVCDVYCPVNCERQYRNTGGWEARSHVEAGAYDFNFNSSFNPYSVYHMTVLSSEPVVYRGTTYDGTAAYVYHPNIKSATVPSFTPDLYETDQMSGSGKKYLITEIGDSCFFGSAAIIQKLNFRNCAMLTRVGHDAFWTSNIEELILPASVNEYGEFAIYFVPNLTDLTVDNPTPVAVPSNCFYASDQARMTLHVPTQSARTAYSQAQNWSNFYNVTTSEELVNYGISIGNTAVTSANKDNITGPEILGGKVSYIPETNTLILDDAYIETNTTYGIYFAEGYGTDNYNNLGIKGNCFIGTSSGKPAYGVVFMGASNIIGEDWQESKLTVNALNSAITFGTTEPSYITNAHLVINSDHMCAIQGPSADMYYTVGTLNVQSSKLELNPGRGTGYYPIGYLSELNLDGCYIDVPYSGYWNPDRSGIVDAYDELVAGQPAVITVGEVQHYGVEVCGVEVTSVNQNNIVGPGIEGSVSYLPSSNIVLLDGAHLTVDSEWLDYFPGIYFYNGRDARVYFQGQGNTIGTEDEPVRYGIYSYGADLNIEGNTYDHNHNALSIYTDYTAIYNSADSTQSIMTTLADGTFNLTGIVPMLTNAKANTTLRLSNATAECIPQGNYYQFNGYDYLSLNDCYIAQPAGGWWATPEQLGRNYGAVIDADGYAYTGTVIIQQGQAPVTALRGDVDDSGDITPADISALINYLLNGSEINMANADCDLDGDISPADISALINYLLGGNVWPASIKAPAAKQEMNLFEVPAMGKAPVKVSATKAVAKAIDLAKTHPAPRQRPQQRQQASRAKVAPAKVAPAVHNEPNGYIVDDKAI